MSVAELVKAVRIKTGLPISECHQALRDSKGDIDGAIQILVKNGAIINERIQNRVTSVSRINTYLHHNWKYASMVEFSCETDYVANTREFLSFMDDICMHVAVSPFKNEDELLDQPYIKDPSVTVREVVNRLISTTGEKVSIVRCFRHEIVNASPVRRTSTDACTV